MALNGKIIQRISKTTSSDVAHSSGYANAQNAGNFGTTSAESFAERREIDANRNIVQSYREAQVAQRKNFMPKALTYEQELKMKRERKERLNGLDDNSKNIEGRRDYNSRQEAGGLRSFAERQNDGQTMNSNGLAANQQKYVGGAARSTEARQAMARRFDATAKPIPKTGGLGSTGFGRR